MEQTAKKLVKLVRQWINNYNQTPWRDGFEADIDFDAGTGTILSMLNEAQRQLASTGYVKCFFRIQMEAGRREYSADQWMHQHSEITYNDKPLERTTIGTLDRTNPSWRSVANGTPRKYYMVADQIGLFPAPAASDPNDDTLYSLVIRADSMVPDLVLEDDVPKRLPARFHELLAIGAAYMITLADTENENAMRRVGFLKKMWEDGKAELKEVTQQRDLEQFDQISPVTYREYWRF